MKAPNDEIRHNAMLQSLERQRNEALTREVHKDAAIALLSDQLQAASRKIAELTAELEKLKPAAVDPKSNGEAHVEQPSANQNSAPASRQ